MKPTRRDFIRRFVGGAAAFCGPSWSALASPGHAGTALIVVFMRGAVDGLNMVIPHGDPAYYTARPTLAVARPGAPQGALPLDSLFGLHPALQALMPYYAAQRLALVHAAGSPDGTRSHFEAQDFMEAGTPGVRTTHDGFLGRALAQRPAGSLQAISLTPAMPRILIGAPKALACANLEKMALQGGGKKDLVSASFARMYDDAVSQALQGAAHDAFAAVDTLRTRDITRLPHDNAAQYPNGPLGRSLRQLAQLVKADVGLQVGFTDVGGWDTHVGQGSTEGRLAKGLNELAAALAAFAQDLGKNMDRVLVVTLSEFGRTVCENGTGGTDHGHGNVMLLLGGHVRGGHVHGTWPGLAEGALYEGRDLAVTTDFRAVWTDVLQHHLGLDVGAAVFPGFAPVKKTDLHLFS